MRNSCAHISSATKRSTYPASRLIHFAALPVLRPIIVIERKKGCPAKPPYAKGSHTNIRAAQTQTTRKCAYAQSMRASGKHVLRGQYAQPHSDRSDRASCNAVCTSAMRRQARNPNRSTQTPKREGSKLLHQGLGQTPRHGGRTMDGHCAAVQEGKTCFDRSDRSAQPPVRLDPVLNSQCCLGYEVIGRSNAAHAALFAH